MSTGLKRLPGIVAASVLASLLWASPAQAATIAVTTEVDELNDDGDCSLREAVQAANTNALVDECQGDGAGIDTITIPAMTITLDEAGAGENANQTGDLDVSTGVTFSGAGEGTTIIEAGTIGGASGNGIDRVFDLPGTAPIAMNDLTIRNGLIPGSGGSPGHGGGINDSGGGTLTLTSVTVTANRTVSGSGAGIFSRTTLNLDDVTISDNIATQNGGGIDFTVATLTSTDSSITGNTAGADGGGVSAGGGTGATTLSFSGGTIAGNDAALRGGGIYSSGSSTETSIENVTVEQNSAGSSGMWGGGGLYNGATLTVTDSTIDSNDTTFAGGGIASTGTLRLTDSAVTGNEADFFAGGVHVDGGTATLEGDTISGNSAPATGGVRIHAPSTITNSTISGNSADGNGIALLSSNELALDNVTISHNTADAGGMVAGTSLVALNTEDIDVSLHNTIVANTLGEATSDCSGPLTAVDHSLIEDPTGCTFPAGTGNLTLVDPELEPLGDNGGLTETHAPKMKSPVVDAGTNTDCPSTDQRGESRPVDGGDVDATATCDMGAVELQTDEMNLLSIEDEEMAEGDTGTTNLVFTVTLAPAIDEEVTVDYATTNGTASAGTDYSNTSGTLTFLANDTSETISVPVAGDTTFESDETFFVDLSDPSENAGFTDAQGVGTITNDDTDPCDTNSALDQCDPDGDEIPNVDDGCDEEAEDVDDFQDDDGCPDPDNDQDDVLDVDDADPNDSCNPDASRDECDPDGDNITNVDDDCDDLAEDEDDKQDADGCPDDAIKTKLSIRHKARRDLVKGAVTTTPDYPQCEKRRPLKFFKKKKGPDALLESKNATRRGRYSFPVKPKMHGKVYVRTSKKTVIETDGTVVNCSRKTSDVVTIP